MIMRWEKAWRKGVMTFSLFSALLGIIFLAYLFWKGTSFDYYNFAWFTFDGLTVFFLILLLIGQGIASLYGLSYMKEYEGKKHLISFSLAWLAFLGSMAGVLLVNNGFLFIFLWELMSLFSFFLVIYEHEEGSNRTAAFIYLVMTHVGTVFLTAAVLYLYSKTGSFAYGDWATIAPFLSEGERSLLFLCFLIGFGTKAGLVPFHIWLPYAHPVAPSPVSALMSGVMVKIALFMMIKLVWLTMNPVEVWWGVLLLILGATSALIGILYASVEQDVKRLLAYSTVENVGILTMALGIGMIADIYNYPQIVALALVAFFWHALHHLLFKSTLFMVAGNIIQGTHTRRIDELGGLLKKMPKTGFWALGGALGLSALPPLGGFWGEWLLFHSLWEMSVQAGAGILKLILPLIIGVLALVSALALATMVKWFSGAFLGQARSVKAKNAKELPWPQTASMGLAMTMTLLTVIWPQGVLAIIRIPLQVFTLPSQTFLADSQVQSIFADFYSLVIPYVLLVVLFSGTIYLFAKNKRRRIAGTWNCGTPLTPRMQYTSLGVTMPLRIVFKRITAFRPLIEREYGENRYILRTLRYRSRMREMYEEAFYRPSTKLLLWCAERIRVLQTGSIHTYLAYILLTLVVVLIGTM